MTSRARPEQLEEAAIPEVLEKRWFASTISAKANKEKSGHPRIIIKKFLHLCASAHSSTDAYKEKAHDMIHHEIPHLKLLFEGIDLEDELAKAELVHLSHRHQDLQVQIQAEEEIIAQKQKEHEESIKYKEQEQAYDELRGECMKLPSRAETAAQIELVLAESQQLKNEIADTERITEVRRKQFAQLRLVLRDLEASVNEAAPPREEDVQPMDVD